MSTIDIDAKAHRWNKIYYSETDLDETGRLTTSEIEAAVDQEIVRRAVADRLDHFSEAKSKSPWELLRHPLTITIVGFVMTSFIGNELDDRFSKREETQIREQRILTAARAREKEALRDLRSFVELAYARQVRSDLVRSAINRGNGPEAIARKATYDEVYTKWNIELFPRLKNLRTLTNIDDRQVEHRQSIFEKAVEYTILPLFGAADWCLTSAYDFSYRNGFPHPHEKELIESGRNCDGIGENWMRYMRSNGAKVRECIGGILSNMIVEIRYQSANVLESKLDEQKEDSRQEKITEELRRSCPVLSNAELRAVRILHGQERFAREERRTREPVEF